MNSPHKPVLLDEIKNVFSNLSDGYFVDCTLGYAGHSCEILNEHKNIKLIACDKDMEAIKFSTNKLNKFQDRVKIYHKTFSEIIKDCDSLPIQGIMADIGVSSLQLDKDERGFGFDSNNLDMRMNQSSVLSAYDVVNRYSKNELERIFKDFGEIREYRKIARIICEAREKASIQDAKTLSSLIAKSGCCNGRKISPSTLVFQAIRIEVNSELEELKNLLESIKSSKINKCIVAIISFHSLEDRIVKQTFKLWSRTCVCDYNVLRCECGNNNEVGRIITKKAIEATENEKKTNPRSRSAKLRVFYIDRRV